jgi:excisionase family DNA binding protein
VSLFTGAGPSLARIIVTELIRGGRLRDEEYVTVAQAARQFGLSQRHLRRLLSVGTIPATKPGHDWLVKPSAVAVYVKQEHPPGRKRKSTG